MLLLAQLVAPPLQPGPVRLPGSEQRQPGRGTRQREQPLLTPDPGGAQPADQPGTSQPLEEPGSSSGGTALPVVAGHTPYSPEQLRDILKNCLKGSDGLQACAAALTARLVRDGYVNTRVYTRRSPAPGVLEVVEGRLVEIRVNSSDTRLAKRIQRLLQPLRGQVLHIPTIERTLLQLKNLPGITNVRGNLSRLGSDPAQGTLLISAQPKAIAWQGEASLRNDGSSGSGEGRTIGVLSKTDVAGRGDTLLLYGELDSDRSGALGSAISSLSYTLPIAVQVQLTGSLGYSRRNLIELPSPLDTFSSSQYQGLGQIEWIFRNTLSQRWSTFAGVSLSRSNSFIAGNALPAEVPASVRSPQAGYLRIGISGNGLANQMSWAGNVYLLQGIASATPAQQRNELASIGIAAGSATAMGGILSSSWMLAPSWQVNLRAAGQVAFNPLTNAMQFAIGSDAGIRGLPGQLISGDSGWLGTGELSWNFWRNPKNSLAIAPFIGCGGVRTTVNSQTASDIAGAGGLLLRWLHGDSWSTELGYINQFQTLNNVGPWNSWLLDKGLYAQLKYRF